MRSLFSVIIYLAICSNDVFGIGGGQNAAPGQFPYIVSLRERLKSNTDKHICGGSILSDQHILTAAHCLQGSHSNIENIFVVVGAIRRQGDGIPMKIAKISIHPDFGDLPKRNDIAMLYTVEKIKFTTHIKPIALPESNFVQNSAVPVLVSGFGDISVS